MSQLEEFGIEKFVHKTRLKLQIYFWGDCQEQFISDGKSIVLVFKRHEKDAKKQLIHVILNQKHLLC